MRTEKEIEQEIFDLRANNEILKKVKSEQSEKIIHDQSMQIIALLWVIGK